VGRGTGRREPALHRAARLGDHEAIRALVADGVDVDLGYDIAQEWGGSAHVITPLISAAGSNDGASGETVQLLLDLGASTGPGPSGTTALVFACAGLRWGSVPGGDASRLQALLAAGADPNARGGNRTSALAFAAGTGDAARVQLLLDAGASLDYECEGSLYSFRSPLHRAAESGSAECVRLLLAAGADVEDPRPGSFVAAASSLDVLRELLAAGADPFAAVEYSSIVDTVARNEKIAVAERSAMLRLLAEHGVDLNDCTRGVTPLWAAACNDTADSVQALLAAGADPLVEPNALGGACWPQDDRAENDETRRKVEAIVAAGCRVDRRDEQGLTPLHGAIMPYSHGEGYASSDGLNVPAAAALIRLGASIDIVFAGDAGPLHVAAANGCPEMIVLLLRVGADPRARTADGKTALDFARDALDRARKVSDTEEYRRIFRTESDAELATRVARMREYHETKLIPNAQRSVDLLK
jgi:ankyrin repeat protein